MKKIFLFITLAIALISLASANPVQEFFQDNVTSLNITISQTESQADFYLNTAGTSFDIQDINLSEDSDISIPDFRISEFLNGVNGEVEIQKNSKSPHFNSFLINGYAIGLADSLILLAELDFTSDDLNNLTFLNDYVQNSLPVASDRHIILEKNGNNYHAWNDQGYGNIEDYKEQIREIINESIYSLNVPNIAEEFLPLLKGNLSDAGIDPSIIDSMLEQLDINYTVGLIDLGNISLKDGDYKVKVFVNDSAGVQYTKNINLHLEGLENTEVTDINNTYTPETPEISYILKEISGIGNNTIIIKAADTSSFSFPSDLKAYKFFDITLSTPNISGKFKFKLDGVGVKNPDKVNLYVYESGSWTKLATTFDGEYFTATTPHFSLFMVAEEKEASSGSNSKPSSYSEPSSYGIYNPSASQTQTENNTIAVGNPEEASPGFLSRITGAVIGTIGTEGTIVIIIILAVVAGFIIILRAWRKGRKMETKLDKRADEPNIQEAEAVKATAEFAEVVKKEKKARRKSRKKGRRKGRK